MGNIQQYQNQKLDTLANVTITTPTTDQVLKYNGTGWVNSAVTSGSSYTLPTASSTTLGGIKVGANLTITDGVLAASNASYVTVSTAIVTQTLQENTVYNFTNNSLDTLTLSAGTGLKHGGFRFINRSDTVLNYPSSWIWYGDNCTNSTPYLVDDVDYECVIDLRYDSTYAIFVKNVTQTTSASSSEYSVVEDNLVTPTVDTLSSTTLVIGNTTGVEIDDNTLVL